MTSLRTIAIAAVSALLISSCGAGGDATQDSAPGASAASASPLESFLACDPARDLTALSGMRLAAEYSNGKFYLPTEPTQAFGMPVLGLLVYDQRYWSGMPMGDNANVAVGAPKGIYTVTFVDAPGSSAQRALASWASAHGYRETPIAGNEDGDLNSVAWAESSAIQSVAIDSLPADVANMLRRVGEGAVTPLSLFMRGGEGESVPAHAIWPEATEAGEISAVHCPGNNMTGVF